MATVALAGCASTGPSTSSPVAPAQQALYDRAVEAGGHLTVFIGTTGNEALDQLRDIFTDQYPGLSLEFVSGSGPDISERFLTEKRNGLSNADVVAMAGSSALEQMAQENFLNRFTPEDANLFSAGQGQTQPDLIHPFASIYIGARYNPTAVAPRGGRPSPQLPDLAGPTFRRAGERDQHGGASDPGSRCRDGPSRCPTSVSRG